LGFDARWKPSKAGVGFLFEISRNRFAFGTAPSTRMHEPEMNAAAGDSR
jgi:hypothetical protein